MLRYFLLLMCGESQGLGRGYEQTLIISSFLNKYVFRVYKRVLVLFVHLNPGWCSFMTFALKERPAETNTLPPNVNECPPNGPPVHFLYEVNAAFSPCYKEFVGAYDSEFLALHSGVFNQETICLAASSSAAWSGRECLWLLLCSCWWNTIIGRPTPGDTNTM